MRHIEAALVAVLVLVCLPGCLTAEQRTARAQYEVKIGAAAERLLDYEDEATAVWADVTAGKLPLESGEALVKKIAENQEKDRETIAGATEAIAELKASEAPWWAFIPWESLIYAGLAAAGLGTPLALKTRTARAETRSVRAERDEARLSRDAVILGVSKGGNAAVKSSIAMEADRLGVKVPVHARVRALNA